MKRSRGASRIPGAKKRDKEDREYTRAISSRVASYKIAPERKWCDTLIIREILTTNELSGGGGSYDWGPVEIPIKLPSIDGTTAPQPNGWSVLNIPPGTSENQRIGRKVCVKKILFKGSVHCNSTRIGGTEDIPESPIITIYLIQKKQTNQISTINSREVYENRTGHREGNAGMLRNPYHMSQYKVLAVKQIHCDEHYAIASGGPAAADFKYLHGNDHAFTMAWEGNMDVHFATDDGNMIGIVDNSVFVAAISTGIGNENLTSIRPWYMTGQLRTTFEDV